MRALVPETRLPSRPDPAADSDADDRLQALAALVEQIDASYDAGDVDRLLFGVNVALLALPAPAGAEDPLAPIELALTEVGARAVRPSLFTEVDRGTAALFGQLYTVLYCDDSAAASVPVLARASGRPVVCGLIRPGHRSRVLAQLLALRSWGRAIGHDVPLLPGGPGDAEVQSQLLAVAAASGLALPWPPSPQSHDQRALRIRRGSGGEPSLVMTGLSTLELGAWRRCVERYRRRVIQAAFLFAAR